MGKIDQDIGFEKASPKISSPPGQPEVRIAPRQVRMVMTPPTIKQIRPKNMITPATPIPWKDMLLYF
jgi:hypothetical protein